MTHSSDAELDIGVAVANTAERTPWGRRSAQSLASTSWGAAGAGVGDTVDGGHDAAVLVGVGLVDEQEVDAGLFPAHAVVIALGVEQLVVGLLQAGRSRPPAA